MAPCSCLVLLVFISGRIYSESNADQYCKGVGGYLGDIKPQEWFDVQYFLYKLKRNGLQDLPIKTSGNHYIATL